MTYASETRSDTTTTQRLLETAEMRELRGITGNTLRDRNRSQDIKRQCNVFSSSEAGEPAEQDELIVELENLGNIRGHILQSAEGKNFYAFQDIPYAEPPIGPNRFRVQPPKPHGAWEGVLNVTENKKTCVQVNDPNSVEDCLVLNVYTPV
uniref:Acetylcholinesterase-like n=1 Tax=Diabrotica virgifera virgifera TaxID=50390 RepID=A0A6P7H3X8_DIAVI